MLDQDKGHAGVGRERVEQLADGVEPPGRGAEPDDRKVVMRKQLNHASTARADAAAAQPFQPFADPVLSYVLILP